VRVRAPFRPPLWPTAHTGFLCSPDHGTSPVPLRAPGRPRPFERSAVKKPLPSRGVPPGGLLLASAAAWTTPLSVSLVPPPDVLHAICAHSDRLWLVNLYPFAGHLWVGPAPRLPLFIRRDAGRNIDIGGALRAAAAFFFVLGPATEK